MTALRIPYAYYPRILFLFMQVLILGTDPSYSYSGKVEAVEWLLKKARGKARERVCDLRHQGIAGRQINYGDFFDSAVRPNTINAADWETMSNVAYDCILTCIHDEKLQYLLAGIDAGNGTELIKRLQNVCGNKQQRIDQLDGKIASMSVATLSGWTNYRDQIKHCCINVALFQGFRTTSWKATPSNCDSLSPLLQPSSLPSLKTMCLIA